MQSIDKLTKIHAEKVWICPVCKTENPPGGACVRCRYDRAMDYERYPVLVRLENCDLPAPKEENGTPAREWFELGENYYFGRGVSWNYMEAVRWYRKAAEQGDAAAQRRLGECCYFGKGTMQNYAEAAAWYRKAAEQGDREAQESYAACCEYGRGVERDRAEAAVWYRLAAEQGSTLAQTNLQRLQLLGFFGQHG